MLLALLLVARAAAEWVEISQQHYRKPVRTTTALDPTRNIYPDVHQNPTKNTYHEIEHPVESSRNTHLNQDVSQTPVRDTYLSKNVKDPVRKYQEPNTTNIHSDQVVFLQPMRDFLDHDEPFPNHTRNFDQGVKPVRFNPFLQDVPSQIPVRNPNIDVTTPPRDTHLNRKVESAVEDTYLNRSITEHNWNQNIHSGNAKFVTAAGPSFGNWNENTYKSYERNDNPVERGKHELDNNVPNTVRIKEETVSGKIERVPNIGSVKRVQLANTPVKSPVLNNKIPETTNKRNNLHKYGAHYDSFSDELDIETSIFNTHEDLVSQNTSNNFKQELSGTELVQNNHVDHEKPTIPVTIFQRHQLTHHSDVDKGTKVIQGYANFTQNSVLENVQSSAAHRVLNQITAANSRTAKPLEKYSTNEDILPDNVSNGKLSEPPKEVVKPNMKADDSRKTHRGSVKIEKIHIEEEKSSLEKNENSSSGEVKVNTMEKILKFVKVVADTISKNTGRGARGKITYLNELKHTLLANIKNRIDTTWPDDEISAAIRRHSRSASPRGHVEFPSSESALMTISFLTFAVFLIKLVLQVIQTYKHKTMVMAPLMVATAGRTVTKKLRENLNQS